MRPKPIASVLSELLARRGYVREQSASALQDVWSEIAGPSLAAMSRPGTVKRGVLEVFLANSTLAQEMSFQKPGLLAKLAARLPEEKIRDMRFRVGPI